MHKIFLIAGGLLLLTFVACSGGKQITQTMQSGQSAYNTGDYQKALADWEIVIAHYKKTDTEKECPVYSEASDAAGKLGQTEKAIRYLKSDLYTPFANGDSYFKLAGLYRQIDNLSNEMDMLEAYSSKYPDGEKIDDVKSRLFEINTEIKNWEVVVGLWGSLSTNTQAEVPIIEMYFLANEKLKNDSVCDRLALQLLEQDNKNTVALEWMAKKLFWQAENKYQNELKAYSKNKTNKQYKKLLNALDVVSSDFKKSLVYFKTLYAVDPSPAYAKYLGDIYNRLDDKKKADYFYKLSKKIN